MSKSLEETSRSARAEETLIRQQMARFVNLPIYVILTSPLHGATIANAPSDLNRVQE